MGFKREPWAEWAGWAKRVMEGRRNPKMASRDLAWVCG